MRLSAPSLGMRLIIISWFEFEANTPGWFIKLSSLCLQFNLGACLGVRLSAPSLGMGLVGWFRSEAEST